MENQKNIFTRLFIYQKERFPILVNAILIAALTFSTISYSRNLTNPLVEVSMCTFLAILTITFTTFFLIRLIDEFKDYEIDKKHRSYLPVQRGVVSLTELKVLIVLLFIIQGGVMYFIIPQLWMFYALFMGYLFLMSFEFFISEKIEKSPIVYTASHMIIVPLIDLFASTGDWFINGDGTHLGLYVLLATSFFNGLVIEFGRKIKATDNEAYNSYTRKYGIKQSTATWIVMVVITYALACICFYLADYTIYAYLILGFAASFLAFIGIKFINIPTVKGSKLIEKMAGVWTLIMYITVGCYAQIEIFFTSLV